MSEQYNVIFKGELLDGFEQEIVQAAFAKAFKIDLEKAKSFFTGKNYALRKKVDHKTAYQFKTALERIGAEVELRRIAPSPSPAVQGLSLEPIEKKETEQPVDEAAAIESNPVTSVKKSFYCPKCGVEQNRKAGCISCGIIFDKFLARNQETTSNSNSAFSNNQSVEITTDEESSVASRENSFSTNALISSLAAAVVGAFIWKIIAVVFDYELGLIAWGIGGAIGFAAAMFGSRGTNAGIICGVLALLSIFGGKYVAYESFKSQWGDNIYSQSEELREVYEEEQIIAEFYVTQVNGEQSKKQFMVDYGYSDSIDTNQVSNDEMNDFNSYSGLRLEKLYVNSMSFDEWLKEGFQANIENYSTFELMSESFDLLDALFLFFGIGTAFRLARNE